MSGVQTCDDVQLRPAVLQQASLQLLKFVHYNYLPSILSNVKITPCISQACFTGRMPAAAGLPGTAADMAGTSTGMSLERLKPKKAPVCSNRFQYA